MNCEKLLLAILLSLIVLLGISTTGFLIVACEIYFTSIGQYSSLVGVIVVLILFVSLIHYFYKNIE